MTWTYSLTDLSTSAKDQVRMILGDTDSAAPLISDEEITFALTQEMNNWGAAARCCETISRNFLRKADVRIGRGGTTLTYSTAAKQYADMAKELRRKATALNSPWSGGRSIQDKLDLASDASLVQPIFSKGLMNSPWVDQSNDDTIADQDDAA